MNLDSRNLTWIALFFFDTNLRYPLNKFVAKLPHSRAFLMFGLKEFDLNFF